MTVVSITRHFMLIFMLPHEKRENHRLIEKILGECSQGYTALGSECTSMTGSSCNLSGTLFFLDFISPIGNIVVWRLANRSILSAGHLPHSRTPRDARSSLGSHRAMRTCPRS